MSRLPCQALASRCAFGDVSQELAARGNREPWASDISEAVIASARAVADPALIGNAAVFSRIHRSAAQRDACWRSIRSWSAIGKRTAASNSRGWLIDHAAGRAGPWDRWYVPETGLVLVNLGGASDRMWCACRKRCRRRDGRFGVALEPEPVFV